MIGERLKFSGNGEHTLEARSDGILQTESGTYLLKAPLTVGASWPGEHGVVRVAALDQAVDVIRKDFRGARHIFNLGHGIRPETPIAHVERMIARVRNG